MVRSEVPVCGLVSGPVGDPVGDPVSGPVGGLVSGPVCGLVDGPVCGPVPAVCGPVETRPAPYSIQWPAGFRCLDIGRASCGFRALQGLVLRWCCSVAEGLLWFCGQWCQSMVRSVVWSGGPFGGPVGGPVSGPVVWFVVWLMVQFVVRSVRSVVRRNTSCSIPWPASFKCLDIGGKGLLFFCNLCIILRSPDPGPRTLCPQNVVRAASWRSLSVAAQVRQLFQNL